MYFAAEVILVLRVLGKRISSLYLVAKALLFVIGQIFNAIISVHNRNPAKVKIDRAFFETLFTLLSVVISYVLWLSITQDDWR